MQRLVVRTGTPVKVNAFAAVESACKRANASVGSRRFTFLFVQRRESIQRTNHIVKKKNKWHLATRHVVVGDPISFLILG